MYSVLIVEDELLVRMGIKVSVDWAAYNMSVSADVADGLAAFQAFRQLKPDIVITDIRMPGMDGIELIRRIREEDQICRILVISCLDDFHTLHSIMGYQISGYLLKATMTEEEILKNLSKVKQELELDRQPHTTVEELKLLPSLEDMLRSYYRGEISDADWQDHLAISQQLLEKPDYLLFIRLNRPETSQPLLFRSVKELLNQQFPALQQGDIITLDRDCLAVLLRPGLCLAGQKIDLSDRLTDLYGQINRIFNLQPFFILRHLADGLISLLPTLTICEKIAEQSFFYNTRIVKYDDLQTLSSLKVRIREQVLAYLDYSVITDQDMRITFDNCICSLIASIGCDNSVFKGNLILFGRLMNEAFLRRSIIDFGSFSQKIIDSTNVDQAMQVLSSFVSSSQRIHLHPTSQRSEIKLVLEYINQNYNLDLSVNDIADLVHLNANYLSNLFKKETSQSLIQYLQSVRIAAAQNLLQANKLHLYEIAEQCGFADEAYFSRLFKQKTGLSPSEWKGRCASI